MHRTLRQLARSPHLRVMAWLAWLILAVAPVHAAPGGMMGVASAPDQGAHLLHTPDHMHHVMPVKADCCGDRDHGGHGTAGSCHCAATCGTVLPVMAMAGLSLMTPAVLHVSWRKVVAPKLAHAPPLRPPLMRTSELT
jgi:hypothetical protein